MRSQLRLQERNGVDSAGDGPDGRPPGGGGGPAVFAEPTINISGLGTAAVTLTFVLPPGAVCYRGQINMSRLNVNGSNRDLDNRSEPLSNPDYWIGWFGDVANGEPSLEGLTASELAALWHYAGSFPHTGSGTEMTSRAAGNVVTLTEVDGKPINTLQVDWVKAAPAGQTEPEPEPEPAPEPEPTASFPWDGMTHAEIDAWAEANTVDCGGSGWDRMTLAGKREWLVAYFGDTRPWEAAQE